jgi:hypothetical protein
MSTSWRQRITKLETLTKGNGQSAWETAQELRELWKDREFLADKDACNGVLDEMASKLSVYADRFGFNLNEMIQMIDHFPDAKDWQTGRLRSLYNETCKLILAKKSKKDFAKKHRITQAQYEALQRENRELKKEVKLLRDENAKLLDAFKGSARAKR